MTKNNRNGSPLLGSEGGTGLQASLKSNDTEEWLDIVWTRPIGYMWAKLFERLGVHPNVVTVISMIIGAGSAWFFMQPSWRIDGWHGLTMNIIGILLLAWANFYDSADGQLARMTGKKTQLGRILDGAAGQVWFIPIYVCLVLRMYNHHSMEFGWLGIEDTQANAMIYGVAMFVFALVSGLGMHAGQCRIADYYRQIHLFFLKGKEGSELDNSKQQRALYEQTSWKENFLLKVFLKTYVGYTRAQEKSTPEFQKLKERLTARYGQMSAAPREFCEEFRALSLPMMKYTNILTFNTRAIALYVCCLADLPWMYLVFETVILSAVCYYMRHTHERFCARLAC